MANVIEYTIKGVDKFSGPMSGVSSAMGKIKDSSWIGKAALVGVGAAAYALTVKMSALMEETGKAAAALNTSSSSFSKAAFAAKMAGLEQSQFASTMMQLSKNTSDASNGLGRATKGFEMLGIDAKKFKTLGMNEQLAVLAEKLEGVQNPQDKLAISMRLFGETGRQMNEVLADGGKNLAAFAKDAEHLGVVVSDKAAAAADELGDSTDRLDAATKGLGMTLAKTLGPAFTIIINALSDVIAFSNRVVKTIIDLGVTITTIFIAAGDVILTSIWESLKMVGELIVATGKWMWDSLTSMWKGGQALSFADTVGKVFDEGLTRATSKIGDTINQGAAAAQMAFADLLNPDVDMEPTKTKIDDITLHVEEAAEKVSKATEQMVTDFGALIEKEFAGFDEMVNNITETTGTIMGDLALGWNGFIESMAFTTNDFATGFYDSMKWAVDAIADGIAEVIVSGGSMRDIFNNIAKTVLQNMISMLIKLGIQRFILAGITKGAIMTESMAQMSAETGRTFASAFASTAAIPIVGPALAPGVAMASVSTMLAGAVGAAAAGSGVGAAIGAHGGMTNVPSEQTYLLDRGERVLSPNQNSDLKEFMASGGDSSGGVVIENLTIHILENATNADSLLNMSKVELDRIVAGPILDSLNRLDKRGIRPESQERKRS